MGFYCLIHVETNNDGDRSKYCVAKVALYFPVTFIIIWQPFWHDRFMGLNDEEKFLYIY